MPAVIKRRCQNLPCGACFSTGPGASTLNQVSRSISCMKMPASSAMSWPVSASPRITANYLAVPKTRDATHDKQGVKLDRFPGLLREARGCREIHGGRVSQTKKKK